MNNRSGFLLVELTFVSVLCLCLLGYLGFFYTSLAKKEEALKRRIEALFLASSLLEQYPIAKTVPRKKGPFSISCHTWQSSYNLTYIKLRVSWSKTESITIATGFRL